MARFVIIGVIIAVAFILYALVDAAMSDANRARGVSKPVWVVIIVVLPVIGAVLWFTIGKSRGPAPVPVRAPDDDPSFTGSRLSKSEIDAHVEELEARLRELDEETFPGVDEVTRDTHEPGHGKAEPGASEVEPKRGDQAAPDGDSSGDVR